MKKEDNTFKQNMQKMTFLLLTNKQRKTISKHPDYLVRKDYTPIVFEL